MKKFIQSLALIILTCCGFIVHFNAQAADDTSAIGYWTTISDEDHKPRSVVQIINHQGYLEGRILKVYAKEGDHDLCINCEGKLKNTPIIGLRFLWDMSPDGDKAWSGGKILDPKTGKTYKCKMSLTKDGKELSVRGYLGISLFGRTQIWVRRHTP